MHYQSETVIQSEENPSQSEENQVKQSKLNKVETEHNQENWVKTTKLKSYHILLSHLTLGMVGGALSQPVLHWDSEEAP